MSGSRREIQASWKSEREAIGESKVVKVLEGIVQI